MTDRVVSQIVDVFNHRGGESYGSEAVTQTEHAIQSAILAKRDGAESFLVAAALLHDIGHILGSSPLPNSEQQSFDDKHESCAYEWLREHFSARVADPVRLHVAAKRYLCTIDPAYCGVLSPTSLKSFYNQGGVMREDERSDFERETYFREAVQLRRWDDEAKDPTMAIPPIEDFTGLLREVMLAQSPK